MKKVAALFAFSVLCHCGEHAEACRSGSERFYRPGEVFRRDILSVCTTVSDMTKRTLRVSDAQNASNYIYGRYEDLGNNFARLGLARTRFNDAIEDLLFWVRCLVLVHEGPNIEMLQRICPEDPLSPRWFFFFSDRASESAFRLARILRDDPTQDPIWDETLQDLEDQRAAERGAVFVQGQAARFGEFARYHRHVIMETLIEGTLSRGARRKTRKNRAWLRRQRRSFSDSRRSRESEIRESRRAIEAQARQFDIDELED